MKSHNPQLYAVRVQELDAEIKETVDSNTYQAFRGIIRYHARVMKFILDGGRLSRKIDAMEPRLHDLKNKIILEVSQNASNSNDYIRASKSAFGP